MGVMWGKFEWDRIMRLASNMIWIFLIQNKQKHTFHGF